MEQQSTKLTKALEKIKSSIAEYHVENEKLTQRLSRTKQIIDKGKDIMSAIDSFENGGDINSLLRLQAQHQNR